LVEDNFSSEESHNKKPKVVAESLTFSSLGPETGYTGSGFSGFPQYLQADAAIVP
jgi:hypothetical protein